ncbi:TIGR03862 family flavoprotein [Halopseudomonas salegens]|uniref:NAD(FAD)-utilizing dehydrogenase n=1 Tax=Halopseudomonas salegens TaxID=1434072 RepID=A0A1H2ELS6_9GAMM|nr:TIGR03862 family flavoprotein [Halopseudomonas salegens]SDT95959.1 hypothetical protein SAMN05216210_0838 [Halopseudomonas salegens]
MSSPAPVVIIGGGPAGLMAADTLSAAGTAVAVYDAMPSVGRKFLLAGIGGMNITHAEDSAHFIQRYCEASDWAAEWMQDFAANELRNWIHDLGIDTFVGSSGRVFPRDMKAAPLLRAWLRRLRERGVTLHTRHRWQGWEGEQLLFDSPQGPIRVTASATILALGGGSWARLGSDGAWRSLLAEKGVNISPLRPSNCGFVASWSEHLSSRFAGHPLKPLIARVKDGDTWLERRGECVLTHDGLEGSLIYALSAPLRQQLESEGHADLQLDLAPDRTAAQLLTALSNARKGDSLSKRLRSKAGLDPVKIALLHEVTPPEQLRDPATLVQAIKHLHLRFSATRPLDEAISSAGGVCRNALTEHLELTALPRVYCVGEMLDWEAPTGGYLLTACFASGRHAAKEILKKIDLAN